MTETLKRAARAYMKGRGKLLSELSAAVELDGVGAALDAGALIMTLTADDSCADRPEEYLPDGVESFGSPAGDDSDEVFYERLTEIYSDLTPGQRDAVSATLRSQGLAPMPGDSLPPGNFAAALQECGHIVYGHESLPGHTCWENSWVLYSSEAILDGAADEGADGVAEALAIQKAVYFGDVLQCTLAFPDGAVYRATGGHAYATRNYLKAELAAAGIPKEHTENALTAMDAKQQQSRRAA